MTMIVTAHDMMCHDLQHDQVYFRKMRERGIEGSSSCDLVSVPPENCLFSKLIPI